MLHANLLSAEEVEELARTHAEYEDGGDIDALMGTLVEDPVYEYHPLRVQLRGASAVRRYYERVRREYTPLVKDATLVELIAGPSAAVIEYAIRLDLDGGLVHDRLVAVMPVQGHRFGGERIYSSERVLRLLLGEMQDEAEPIAESD
jgi:hypothetical protein